jgi:hypothetical protein
VPRRVLVHKDFVADARRHEEWLVRAGREDWLRNLLGGIEEIAALLERYPEIGPIVSQDRRVVLRSFPFRRYPYVVWFAYRRRVRVGDVWLVRLFGAHQDRPNADPSSWRSPDRPERKRSI